MSSKGVLRQRMDGWMDLYQLCVISFVISKKKSTMSVGCFQASKTKCMNFQFYFMKMELKLKKQEMFVKYVCHLS